MSFVSPANEICDQLLSVVLYDCGQQHKRHGVQRVIVWSQFHKESCNCPRRDRDRAADNTLHLFSSTIKFSFRILA